MDLQIQKLSASANGTRILKNINLKVPGKGITVLMGPNGSGKSTLAHVLMGNPNYKVTGKIEWQKSDLLKLETHKRAKLGLFLSFQNPCELPGVNIYEFLLAAYKNTHNGDAKDFNEKLQKALADLKLHEDFLDRSVNEGFSGGEKKKAEILQLKMLEPKIAILDEIDSGLDIDALKLIAKNIKELAKKTGILIITHYQRLLNYLEPAQIYVMMHGEIVKSGKKELIKKLESKGYGWLNTK